LKIEVVFKGKRDRFLKAEFCQALILRVGKKNRYGKKEAKR
jgi:hypothetical protein